MSDDPRDDLARRIAGEITLSSNPGATLRKWRTDFDVSQTELADRLDVSSSNYPRYDVNHNTGGPLYTDEDYRVAENTVHHSATHATHVDLPVRETN